MTLRLIKYFLKNFELNIKVTHMVHMENVKKV